MVVPRQVSELPSNERRINRSSHHAFRLFHTIRSQFSPYNRNLIIKSLKSWSEQLRRSWALDDPDSQLNRFLIVLYKWLFFHSIYKLKINSRISYEWCSLSIKITANLRRQCVRKFISLCSQVLNWDGLLISTKKSKRFDLNYLSFIN